MAVETYEELMVPLAKRFAGDEPVLEDTPVVPAMRVLPADAPGVARAYLASQSELRDQLLAHIHVLGHNAFERLVIDILLHMGYGSRRRDLVRCLGKSHDGGVDGVIEQDELALDVIYIQAKRLKPGSSVPVSQDFVGSLEARHATKGLFVTTGLFTSGGEEFVRAVSRRVVLVNGWQLADIMMRHNIGVRVKETYQFKELEMAYFQKQR
jgi:restriction system protein